MAVAKGFGAHIKDDKKERRKAGQKGKDTVETPAYLISKGEPLMAQSSSSEVAAGFEILTNNGTRKFLHSAGHCTICSQHLPIDSARP